MASIESGRGIRKAIAPGVSDDASKACDDRSADHDQCESRQPHWGGEGDEFAVGVRGGGQRRWFQANYRGERSVIAQKKG